MDNSSSIKIVNLPLINLTLIDNYMNTPPCHVIAWEVTRRCNLHCAHCRGNAQNDHYENELSSREAFGLIDEIAALGNPLIIFTGGEPLLRQDIFELASYAKKQGLRCVMSVNGTLLTAKAAKEIKAAGISRCSISIDAANPRVHDLFRGKEGAFAAAMQGVEYLKDVGLSFQINTTVAAHNINELAPILELCKEKNAAAWHVFMLIHTGRGSNLEPISPEGYEKTLVWLGRAAQRESLEIKPTCAPQYQALCPWPKTPARAHSINKKPAAQHMARGCMAGAGFCFISHTGVVQPCGYLEATCGNIRTSPLSDIWKNSPVFKSLRGQENYAPPCAECTHFSSCSGCRARSLWQNGNILGADPLCTIYNPPK